MVLISSGSDQEHASRDFLQHAAVGDVKLINEQLARGTVADEGELDLRCHLHELEVSSAEQRAIRALLRTGVAKFAPSPTGALQDSGGADQGVRRAGATRNLSDL